MMVVKKRGQISTEYMIVVGFVIFFIILILGVALFYSAKINDNIRMRQIEQFSSKVISSAESVHYAGEPSKSTISVYLPKGVTGLSILENEIAVNYTSSSGVNKIVYSSKVPLEGEISTVDGVKKIKISALQNSVNITGLN
jgi:uncharacterized protein (UPF0333 family)